MTNVSVADWINYRPSVGVEQAQMIGYPGTGKSNMSSGLFQKCLKKGEGLVMPGDRFTEWRHYLYHPKFPTKMIGLVPKNFDIQYYPDQETVEDRATWHEVDYANLNILDYLDADHRLVVIYDQFLKLPSRSALWTKIVTQLLNRDPHMLNQQAIGLLFHEAGILFPQNAVGNQWLAVNEFAERFVECRKGLVRTMMVSQIETEIMSTIRGKCMYAFIKKSVLNKTWPKLIREIAPFTPLNEYQIVLGKGLYNTDNVVSKYFEKKQIFKMIPTQLIDLGPTPNGKREINTTKTFRKKIRSKGRISLGQELSQEGFQEGDTVDIILNKVEKASV